MLKIQPKKLSILVPVEHLNILVSMLVELADAAVNVVWDTIPAGMKDGLLYRFFQEHVLVGMLFKHPLQQQRSPRLF